MAWNNYRFVTEWTVKGNIEEVFDLLADPLHYPDWWCPGSLEAREIRPPRPDRTGGIVGLRLKKVVPYHLSWQLESMEAAKPYRLAAKSTGDFEGRGIWTLKQQNGSVKAVFEWEILAEKPFLKMFSFFLKPFFIWNHHRVMSAGEKGLCRSLQKKEFLR